MINFNRSQRLGLDLDRHIALDAGAGTGKTTVMSERYVQHLITPEQRSTITLPNGPRQPLQGHGALRAPRREMTGVEEWPGLLPSEVVAITFTNKAAAELKSRIRNRLALTRAMPLAQGDESGIYDPRLRSQADVEMLMSALDDAPISTIDAFLSSLVSPHLDLISPQPAKEKLVDEMRPILIKDSINTAWRIRNSYDALEAGVYGDCNEFINARNRLSVLLGGQSKAEKVLSGMMNRSLFVDEANRSMISSVANSEHSMDDEGRAPVEYLLDMFSSSATDAISIAEELHTLLGEYVDFANSYHAQIIQPGLDEAGSTQTRFQKLVDMAFNPLPHGENQRLQWIYVLALASGSSGQFKKYATHKFLPKGYMPQDRWCQNWPAGIKTASSVGITDPEKSDINDGLEDIAIEIRQILNSREGKLCRMLGHASYLLSPSDELAHMPDDCPLRYRELGVEIPNTATGAYTRIGAELQMSVLRDLLAVHKGCQDILAQRKSLDGVSDHDDVQTLASDLLLARCPKVVRFTYPPEVVRALDSLGDRPWQDHHISRALTLALEHESCHADLQRRFAILQDLRRRFRAFIIDEYQDTNPAHFRLLARLWGARDRRSDEVAPPFGPWDPTVCIVGDMKQSIYRFRQADVEVMRTAVEAIREANETEEDDERFSHLKRDGYGRDPRPTGAGGLGGSFSNQHFEDGERVESSDFTYVPVAVEDGDGSRPITGERRDRRGQGHIDLTSNHRTVHNLLRVMNGLFDDVFDERHHALPGDWHANAQPLIPARDSDLVGELEWLLPLQQELDLPSTDQNLALDPFRVKGAQNYQLEHELIAQRLASLIAGAATRVRDTEQGDWLEVEESGPEVRPEDIIILVHSRTQIPDLIQRLRSHGIPVIADRQGQLLAQSVVEVLMNLLGLVSNSKSRSHAVALARSVIIGMNDERLNQCFTAEFEGDMWQRIQHFAPSEKVAQLVARMAWLARAGAIYDVIETALDHSDLLTAYPQDSDRQNAEAWLALAERIGGENGHNPSKILAIMNRMAAAGTKGPSSVTTPSAGAVQIMTIFSAKGLQAPVVVVAGMFRAGTSDTRLSVQDNVLVTPQVVAGRISPWNSGEKLNDGLWIFAKEMDDAQKQAERRREFYVALTRVKNRLILAGAPLTTASETEGVLKFEFKPQNKSMGKMLIEGLRYLSWQARLEESPWLLDGDLDVAELPLYTSASLEINPSALVEDAMLGLEDQQGIRIYHSPHCFDSVESVSMLAQIERFEENVASQVDAGQDFTTGQTSKQTSVLRMTAHGLDTSFNCRRRHWLSQVKGWNPESISGIAKELKQGDENWPSATTFGTIMHRFIEVALTNPAKENPIQKLGETWQIKNENLLTDSDKIDQVLSEFGIVDDGDEDSRMRYQLSSKRIAELGHLIQEYQLGRMVEGQEFNGKRVEAIRTELPFLYAFNKPFDDAWKRGFSPQGEVLLSQVENCSVTFDGRADLVLALSDSSQGYLQVVDLKTKGCRQQFNSDDPTEGHPLQEPVGDMFSSEAQTQAEYDILYEHRLQLALYSLALEAKEAGKPQSERRIVLPPAILIGASGRMVSLTDEQYDQAKSDLEELLSWMALLASDPQQAGEPQRQPASQSRVCKGCPFYRGDIRLCGPIGEELGWQSSLDS